MLDGHRAAGELRRSTLHGFAVTVRCLYRPLAMIRAR
jgi:hypothetical protein